MYCKFCGKKNPDGAVFCKECGKNLSGMKDVVKNVPALPEQQETETVGDFDIFSCPSCRADSEFCYPVVKTNVKTSGGGYSFWNGCCGLILLGPLGLLCGACGGSVRTKVRSETWWVWPPMWKRIHVQAICSGKSEYVHVDGGTLFIFYLLADWEQHRWFD